MQEFPRSHFLQHVYNRHRKKRQVGKSRVNTGNVFRSGGQLWGQQKRRNP